ncbi:CcoQ/FixQ family Cbb3-type cytochrome c oxidase assembly chaperone [Sunxiuqinia elliptica]|uniref:Cbb3-type cytochrome oxidase component FixQ n=1 Tax=Sunxiuqinia elliptica TaxID=655355 RepID=A0A4R6GM35_9BACT|nr:CcoQ/FixQ family Cbb3-type cytochrome c oxidase assembly chaperone [Sunxiuqinia elliptica]TDN96259.1 Cbb3-type cytochrome oxidase component FixQ [Sunxiuqinia elliptica]TDO67970.1 Cbb3-type cytochrome oxidase component FixQ [Sunxiuqinia elliptica]
MIKEHLQSIIGVELYAIVGFLIFFVFFILVTIHTIRMDKSRVKRLSEIPLDDDVQPNLH